MNIAAIVLAAGFSRRLGRPKQLVEIGGETLLERAARVAHEAELQPVLVVINPDLDVRAISDRLRCEFIRNEEALEGIASSIRAGVYAVQALHDLVGAVLMTCDQVATRPEHLRLLSAEPQQLTASSYEGNSAVPAYFPRAYYPELLRLKGDMGARALLQHARILKAECLGLDVDTEADVERARCLLEAGPLL